MTTDGIKLPSSEYTRYVKTIILTAEQKKLRQQPKLFVPDLGKFIFL